MKTSALWVGMDISKGYADLHMVNHARSILATGRYDDTPEGHAAVRALVLKALANAPDACMTVGVESSGGLERNWVKMLRTVEARVTVAVLNPLAVARFLAQDLHRSVTDAKSAAGIARYLLSGMRLHQVVEDPLLEGTREMYRCHVAAVHRLTIVKNQLQSLVPRVQPDLVRYMRNGVPRWVLVVLTHYPTAATLARARATTLARIPFVTHARAESLITAARHSVAAQVDAQTGVVIQFLANEILRLEATLEDLQRSLFAALETDPAVRCLMSIPGIGAWGAVSLRCEIGAIARFPSAEALTAYAGLDPRVHQSGDGLHRLHISKRGRRRIRAILYMLAFTAIQRNPIIAAFYERLRASGKPHRVAMTACMRKLLHLVYACWVSARHFDASYADRHSAQRKQDPPQLTPSRSALAPTVITAPVSRHETKRRKAAAMPQTRIVRVIRGPGAAPRR